MSKEVQEANGAYEGYTHQNFMSIVKTMAPFYIDKNTPKNLAAQFSEHFQRYQTLVSRGSYIKFFVPLSDFIRENMNELYQLPPDYAQDHESTQTRM